jgi:rubredoxin---NAD+ reductase
MRFAIMFHHQLQDLKHMSMTRLNTGTVIIGSGMAGWGIAKTLRSLDANAIISLVSQGDAHVYSKPMLSNALALKKHPDQLIQSTGAAMAAQLGATLHAHTTVTHINRETKSINTSQGVIQYTHLVLALGAQAIRLPMPGSEHVLSVNDLSDYAAFRAALPAGGVVALLGGGLIGSEFANDLAASGHRVHVIDPSPWPIGNLISAENGAGLKAALEGLSVQFYMQDVATELNHSNGQHHLTLRSGKVITADVVLSAVGLRPNVALAQEAGLLVERGIVVDAYGRTNDPHIFALGDCAAYMGQGKEGTSRAMPYVWPLIAASKAIAATLAGNKTAIAFKAMPVRVKTPAYPISVAG